MHDLKKALPPRARPSGFGGAELRDWLLKARNGATPTTAPAASEDGA